MPETIKKNLFFKFNSNIYLIYFVYISTIAFLSIIYATFILNIFDRADEEFNLILKNIQFGYGNLIYNLVYKGEFYLLRHHDIPYYLGRLPFHPLLMACMYQISKNIFFIYVLKNILIYSVLFFISFKIFYKKNILIFYSILILVLLNPYNLHVSLSIDFADCYTAIFVPCIFLLITSSYNKKYFIISIIMFILYLTKTSMFFLTLLFPIIFLIFEKKYKFINFLPILSVLLAVLIWGSYGYYKTQKFPFLKTGSSTNSEGMSAIMNKDFKNFYPNKSVDLIPGAYKIDDSVIKNNLKTEWDIFEYFDDRNKNYLINNKKEYFFNNMLLKTKFIIFGIYKDGLQSEINGTLKNQIKLTYLLNKIILILGIYYSFLTMIKNLYKKKKIEKISFYYLVILFLTLLPNFAGWATAKHLVSITNLSLFYLTLKFYIRKNEDL